MAFMEKAREGDMRMQTAQETPVWAVKHGVIGGIIGGITFALAEMIGGKIVSGSPLVMPLKVIASIPIGDMPPKIATSTAIPVGLITHMVMSMIFGVIFALIVAYVPMLRVSPIVTVAAASVYGLLLWLINFYVLAPAISRPWFTTAPKGQQFVYHTFFFGTVYGLYLLAVMLRERSATPATDEGV